MKIMSVDYGDARTGIAFSDIRETLASPYTVIKETYQPKLIAKLCEIIKKENAEKIINHIKMQGVNCYEIGEIVPGNKQVEVVGEFNW